MSWPALAKLSTWLRILALIAITEWGVIPEAIPMGLQTVRNRQATGWWTEEQIIEAYHGLSTDLEPPCWTYQLAWESLQQLGNPNGYLFALGNKDVAGLVLPRDRKRICNGHWCVIFTREFPQEVKSDRDH